MMLKSLFSIALLGLFASVGFGQDEEFMTPPAEKTIQMVDKDIEVNMYHNIHDLEELNKQVLTKIYLKRVQIINELLPLMALKAEGGDYVEDISIPLDKPRLKAAKEYAEAKEKYTVHLNESLPLNLSYADSKELIWGIVFLERIIADMNNYLTHDQVQVDEHTEDN